MNKGIALGWEDAAAAHAEDQRRIRWTWRAAFRPLAYLPGRPVACAEILAPLMQDMVASSCQKWRAKPLAPTVLETLMPLAEQLADEPVTLWSMPVNRKAIEDLLEQATALPVTIVEEPTLGEGQAFLRLGPSGSAYRSCPRHGRNCGCCAASLDFRKRTELWKTWLTKALSVRCRSRFSSRWGRPGLRYAISALQRDAVLPLDRRVDDPWNSMSATA